MNFQPLKSCLSVICLASVMFSSFLACAADVSRNDQTVSGLLGWLVEDDIIRIELNPLLKDQVRAFYLGRGFSQAVTERIAEACVFQTVIKNVSGDPAAVPFEVDLSRWRILDGQGETPLPAKSAWVEQLKSSGAIDASILAFRWATFPTRQNFDLEGDYGWGMILFGISAGDTFNLRVTWHIDGNLHEQLIEGMRCPA